MRIAGVDEAGRGPLAGPVVVAAVILQAHRPIPGLADSKSLSPRRRQELADQIRQQALAWAVVRVEVAEIDRLNILQATLVGMARALLALRPSPELALIDGNQMPRDLPCPARTLVGGDGLEAAISAASILAKTERDALCLELEQRWPGYGFGQHKGYPTPEHLARLQALGPCPEHRSSFAPVAALIRQGRLFD